MERLFRTHRVRVSRACDPVWTLTTPDIGGLSRPEKVIVPGVWESHPALRSYRGRGVYEQELTCGGRLRFWLGGVSFRAKVYLDGKLLGEHLDPYTGFEALTEAEEGRHLLRVEADNRFGEDTALLFPNDYYAYGGIHRPVLVETLAEAWIPRMKLIPRRTPEGWALEAEVTVRALAQARSLTLRLSAAGAEAEQPLSLSAGEAQTLRFTLACPGAASWSPGHPALYEVEALLLQEGEPVDDLIDRVGFREIRVEGSRVLLNGAPLRLVGFNRHEEYGGFGLSVPLAGMAQDLQLMRDAGANCVRTCHYPNDPRFLDLCDETGMLVWEESHARGLSEERMRHPRFLEQILLSTEEMVAQHINHPCVFVWGCLNECADDTPYGAACYRQVFERLRALDGSRPVTAALLARPGGIVYGDMDIVSVNIYPQWYDRQSPQELLNRKLAEAEAGGGAGKPVIVSEIGAGAIYGYHDPLGLSKWSEERQCEILRAQLTAVLADPRVTGVLIWQFADVRVDEAWSMSRPRTFNNKGVVSEYRQPKLAFRTVRELFAHQEGSR